MWYKKIGFLLMSVLLLTGCAGMDWQRAMQIGTIESYQEFVKKYPQTEFARQANDKIEQLQWQTTEKTNSKKGYEDFLSSFPSSLHRKDAENRIDMHTWEETKRDGSASAYRNFLTKYPASPNAGEAGTQIEIRNVIADIQSGGLGKRFVLSAIQPSGKSKETVTIETLGEQYRISGYHTLFSFSESSGWSEFTVFPFGDSTVYKFRGEVDLHSILARDNVLIGDVQMDDVFRKDDLKADRGNITRLQLDKAKAILALKGVTFRGGTDKGDDYVMFAIVKEVGFVHIGGKGKIIQRDNKVVDLNE